MPYRPVNFVDIFCSFIIVVKMFFVKFGDQCSPHVGMVYIRNFFL